MPVTEDYNWSFSIKELALGNTGPAGGIVFYISNGGFNGLEAPTTKTGTAKWGGQGTS